MEIAAERQGLANDLDALNDEVRTVVPVARWHLDRGCSSHPQKAADLRPQAPLEASLARFLLANTEIARRLAGPLATPVSQFALHLRSQRLERVVPAYERVASGPVGSVPVVTVEEPENHRQVPLSFGELAERGGVERAPIPIVEILDPLRPVSAHADVVASRSEVDQRCDRAKTVELGPPRRDTRKIWTASLARRDRRRPADCRPGACAPGLGCAAISGGVRRGGGWRCRRGWPLRCCRVLVPGLA